MMHVVCPCCATAFPLEAGLNDADARRFAVLMGALPSAIARHVPRYLQLFKPRKQGLRWSRALVLLEELAAAIESGIVRRHGRDWCVTAAQWAHALEVIVSKDDLRQPLGGHAYLFEIVTGLADKMEAHVEAKVERARQTGAHRERPAVTTSPVRAREILGQIQSGLKGPAGGG